MYSFSESYKPGGITVTGLYYAEENPNLSPKDLETGKYALPICGAYFLCFLACPFFQVLVPPDSGSSCMSTTYV